MTTIALTAGFVAVPQAAYAAGTTALSATEMVAALEAVSTTSTAASQGGWKATMSAVRGSMTYSSLYVVDAGHGVVMDQSDFGTGPVAAYAAAGRGTYTYIAYSKNMRAAVRMMGRPAVRYMFRSQPTLNLDDYVDATGPTPAKVLTDDPAHAGTKTVQDDGSTDYTYTDDDGNTFTMQVDPAGALTDVQVTSTGLSATLTYTYGAQQATLPAASVTIGEKALSQAVTYLTMPAAVKKVASDGAAEAVRTAGGRTLKVAALRAAVRYWATVTNTRAGTRMIKLADVSRGVRVYATNPWTRKTVAYTVKASGTKAVVRG
ncbi:hypothetical protein [Couchioplanes azureus]|uniref:hypothetical protein n=1 Tax=Couchioplanes caeruleus TaxID=56438 RepID=UPI001670DE2C|nr:hypothetical protein [Couchioplanes caeruleus]